MAKKKQPNQNKTPKMSEDHQTHQNDETTLVNVTQENSSKMVQEQNTETTPVDKDDDGTSDKLSKLRSLNEILLNETAKKRLEISALLEDKKMLETELTRSELEVESVRAELTRASEELVKVEEMEKEMREVMKERDEIERRKCKGEVEIEKLKNLGEELKGEIERGRESFEIAVREKEALEMEVKVKEDEVMELREKLSEMELKERSVEKEMGVLKGRYEIVAKALRESEEMVEGMRNEVEGLSGEKDGFSRENERLRKVGVELEERISELEKEVVELNGVVVCLREGEEKWGVKVFELEGRNGEVVRELDGLKSEFGGLLEEKKAKEREIEGLVSEKLKNLEKLEELERRNDGVVRELDGLKCEFEALLEEKKTKEREIEVLIGEKRKNLDLLEELEAGIEGVKRINEQVLGEKSRLEEANLRQGDEIRELKFEVDEIRGNLLSVQESNKVQLSENVKLMSEVNGYKSALEGVMKERDEVKRVLDEEKMNGVKLQMTVSEISKKMEETVKVIEELRGTNATVIAEKKEVENKYSKLAEEKDLIEKNFVQAKENVVELEGSLRSRSEMFISALVMLKNTAMQLSEENRKKVEEEGISGNGEMEPYMEEIEAIRAVVRSREEKVGAMEKQVEMLHLSVVDAKKKSFWTLVSSATTILAAVVSFAYATRVR